MVQVFKNRFSADLRIFVNCVKKIDKTRFHKLMKCVGDSILADCINPENADHNDMMFEPRTEYESMLWNMYRNLAKKELNALQIKTEKGKLGGRPPKTIKEVLEETSANLSENKSKDCILINDSFFVSDYAVFKPYIKEMPSEVIESVERWLKDKKSGQRIPITFITNQFINFANRQKKPIFKKI